MEYPEDPRPPGEPRTPDAHSPEARADREAEEWLRRELAFLQGVERRILRRSRMRHEAWRAAAVALILAIFACCWYLAALGSDHASSTACPSGSPTAAAGSGSAGSGSAGSSSVGAARSGSSGAHAGAVADGVDATASGCSS